MPEVYDEARGLTRSAAHAMVDALFDQIGRARVNDISVFPAGGHATLRKMLPATTPVNGVSLRRRHAQVRVGWEGRIHEDGRA